MALARSELETNDASSQIFFLLKVGRGRHALCTVGVSNEEQAPPSLLTPAASHDSHHRPASAACFSTAVCLLYCLQESELTPTGSNLLDGRYAVLGYVTENAPILAEIQVGDKIEYAKVTEGLENLQRPKAS